MGYVSPDGRAAPAAFRGRVVGALVAAGYRLSSVNSTLAVVVEDGPAVGALV